MNLSLSLSQYECFLAAKALQHYIEIQDCDTIPYSYNLSKDIFIVHASK